MENTYTYWREQFIQHSNIMIEGLTDERQKMIMKHIQKSLSNECDWIELKMLVEEMIEDQTKTVTL